MQRLPYRTLHLRQAQHAHVAVDCRPDGLDGLGAYIGGGAVLHGVMRESCVQDGFV